MQASYNFGSDTTKIHKNLLVDRKWEVYMGNGIQRETVVCPGLFSISSKELCKQSENTGT